jgi:glutathione synthase/RimK-type ligase-like ATP-grasp enzyme
MRGNNPYVVIVSRALDLHAHIVVNELQKFGDVRATVLASDQIYGSTISTWQSRSQRHARLPSEDGSTIRVEEINLIWWRRGAMDQREAREINDENVRGLIDADCWAALTGILEVAFSGVWVSHPVDTERAENKILQLMTAANAGLTVPNTLVTQDLSEVRKFYHELGGAVVVKALRGARAMSLPTRMLSTEDLQRTEAVAAAPAIYQEYVQGTRHLRVHCFGEHLVAVAIESPELDWRQNLSVPISPYELPSELQKSIIRTLRRLNLQFGVCDLKETPDGEIVWLEVNPQGQFAFLDGLGLGLNLCSKFAEYIRDIAINKRKRDRMVL